MATNFPGSVDSFPRPTSTTNTDDPGFELDVVVDNLSDALEAVESKVLAGPSGYGGPLSAIPGGYLRVPQFSSLGNQTGAFVMTAGVAYAIGFWLPSSTTLTTLGIGLWTNGTGTSVTRLGLYTAGATGYPDALIVDAGTVNSVTGASAVKNIACSLTLVSGVYFAVAVGQGTSDHKLLGSDLSLLRTPMHAGMNVDGGGAQAITKTGITGALPSTFPAGGTPSRPAPDIFLGA